MIGEDKPVPRNVCKFCGGIAQHNHFCLLTNGRVFYAYQIIVEPNTLTKADELYLRSLGVLWIPLDNSNPS